jgi:hypothetical protein
MGDTIDVMKTCVLAVALVACSTDPTLHVVVVHPMGLTVASTTVSVYAAKTLTCEDIEYGNVDAATLEGQLIAQETIGSGSLSGLPRTDEKLIVARGYDVDGNLIAAGCADKGVVSGAATVEVDTEVAAIVSVALADASGQTDLFGIATTVTDQSGKAIDGRQVWWRVYGPAGSPPDPRAPTAPNVLTDGVWEPAQPACTKNGLAVIHPVPPNLIGGFEVELRVAWAASPPRMFSSFSKIGLALTPLSLPPNATTKYCARYGTSIACLDNSGTTPVASTYTASVSAGAATLTKSASSAAIPPETIALYDMNNGTDVYAATSTCAVANVFGTGGGHVASCLAADDVMLVPACGNTSAKLLFHVPGGASTDSVHVIDLATGQAGTVTPTFSGSENRIGFNTAGCVTVLDPKGGAATVQQVLVLDFSKDQLLMPQTRALYNCPQCANLALPIAGAGVGFRVDTEARLVIPIVDATGVSLSQGVLLPDASDATMVRFVERSRAAAASVPSQIVAGNFDADDGADLLYDISTRRGGTAFEINYARTVGTDPLEALSPGQPALVDQMLVGDVTNDSYDDVTILGRTLALVPQPGLAVVPTRVQAQDAKLSMQKPDSTCTP